MSVSSNPSEDETLDLRQRDWQKPLRGKDHPPGRCHDGGADRDRTGGLINAIDALSQLSYSPVYDRHEFLPSRVSRVNSQSWELRDAQPARTDVADGSAREGDLIACVARRSDVARLEGAAALAAMPVS